MWATRLRKSETMKKHTEIEKGDFEVDDYGDHFSVSIGNRVLFSILKDATKSWLPHDQGGEMYDEFDRDMMESRPDSANEKIDE